MKVFNTFFKITYKNKFTFILYIIIFVAISSMTSQNNPTQVESFESSKVSMAVIDRDHSVTSQGIYDYLDGIHNLVEVKDSKEAFQDELYYRNVAYILIIPENFEKDLIAGKEVNCENIEVPGSISGIYVNMQLEQVIKILKNYLTIGIEPQEAWNKTLTIVNQNTKVTVDVEETTATSIPKYYNFFAIMPYPLLAILIGALGIILLVFNQEDLKRRTICSSLSLKKRNSQLAIASFIISFGVLIILLIIPFFLYGSEMLSNPLYKYLLLNSFAFLIVSMSIGFLAGIISKKEEHVSIYSTSVSLFLNFLGGIFVPLSIMPEKVVFFSKFLPTYWYTQVIEVLAKNRVIEGKSLDTVLFSIAIQFAFALAIFGIALVISRKKAQEA
jgi:ABC-2 type transport system permease protein